MDDHRLSAPLSRLMVLCCALLLLLPVAANAVTNVIETIKPIVAIVNNPDVPTSGPDFIAVAINGAGFGAQVTGSEVLVKDLVESPYTTYTFAAIDSRVIVWTDNRIVIKLPPELAHPRIWLELDDGSKSAPITAERYNYNYYATNSGAAQSTNTNPVPATVANNGSTTGYINEQWHADLKQWDLATGVVSKIGSLPKCPGLGCFAVQIFGFDIRTDTSVLGDGVMVDPTGRAWFTEGGAANYTGAQPNHSRIVSWDPATSTYKIYNVPGDDNEVSGLAWDAVRNRVWFSQRARSRCIDDDCVTPQPAKLVSFNPDNIASVNSFDFVAAAGSLGCPGGSLGAAPSTPPTEGTCTNDANRSCFTPNDCVLVSQICPIGGGDDSACYHEYPISDSTQVTEIAIAPGGDAVWYANNFGTIANIGRLDITDGDVVPYPVRYTAPGIFPVGPLKISVSANGDALFSHPTLHTLGRFDGSRAEVGPYCNCEEQSGCSIAEESNCKCRVLKSATNTDCTTSPDATCINECIDERVPVGFASVYQTVSGIAEDPLGRVWFNQGGRVADIQYASSVGFWKGDRTSVVLFPSPQIYAASGETCTLLAGGSFGGYAGTDITVDRSTGDVWFTDFCQKRIGRLQRLPNDVCN